MSRDPFTGAFVAWFVFCTVLALTVMGVGIWAVIELVSWVVSK